MISFRYARANDVADAVRQIAGDPNAKFVAGGTNLIDLMKMDVERPTKVIDITRLPLNQVENTPGGGLRIGALVRNSDLAYHPHVEERYPVLASAIMAGASQQLRNMASTGGNLLQRTRCHYFYDTATPCNKREPGSGCSAIDGQNRMHAILGASDACIATHPSDMCVALALLDAKVHVSSASGDRVIAFAEFHRSPGDTPWQDANLNGWRDHHRGRTAAERLRHELYVSEDSRPALLRIRPGFRRGRARARWRHHQGRPLRARGRRAQALARSTGRSRVARATRQCGDVRSRGRRAAARRQRLRAQHLQDRSRAPLHLARAHTSRARHAAVAVVQEDRLSTTMAHYIGTPTSRVDGFAKVTGAAKYAAEFNAPGLVYGSVVDLDNREGPHRAHRSRRRAARRGRARRAHAREPSDHGGQRSGL